MYIINCSHDEIVMLGEGYCVPTVIWKDEENEIVDKIKWKCISEDIIKHSTKVQQIMEDVEATVLEGVLDAKAEVSIAPYWSK
jgi:hypothetical protein